MEEFLLWFLAPFSRFLHQLWIVRISLLSLAAGALLMTVGPAQDLFLDGASDWYGWPLFYLTVGLVWAVPVHYCARWALDRATAGAGPETGKPYYWLPTALGVACYLAVYLSAHDAAGDLADSRLPASATAIASVTAFRYHTIGGLLGFLVYTVVHDRMVRGYRTRAMARGSQAPSGWDAALLFFRWGYAIATVLLFVWALFFPANMADFFPRSSMIPVLLGGWVPIAGYLAVLSGRIRFPLLFAVIAAIAFAGVFSQTYHDVRVYRSKAWEAANRPEATGLQRQTELKQAIAHWRRVNGCDPILHPEMRCPPAILVAAEGGASRSGFFTATVLGALLDAHPGHQADGSPAPRRFIDAVFAMSGVSGGAFGVATTAAALRDSTDGTPPCRIAGTGLYASADAVTTSWRACLQALTAGDYLTVVAVGLGFRDWLLPMFTIDQAPGDAPRFADRSALLEMAMERHYHRIVGRSVSECVDGVDTGLCRPFGYVDHDVEAPWHPLLFLNSSTVEHGRLLVYSDIQLAKPSTNLSAFYQELFPSAFDAFEIGITQPTSLGGPVCAMDNRGAKDVRLSTAIVASARFPLISSAGTLRNAANQPALRIVDGGYFDNSGLTALAHLIPELHRDGIPVVVTTISNDPVADVDPARRQRLPKARTRNEPSLPVVDTGLWAYVSERYLSPILALNNSRTGHNEALRVTTSERVNSPALGTLPADLDNYVEFAVRADSGPEACKSGEGRSVMRSLPMSWWLSKPVQAHMQATLCSPASSKAFATISAHLAKRAVNARENPTTERPPGRTLPSQAPNRATE